MTPFRQWRQSTEPRGRDAVTRLDTLLEKYVKRIAGIEDRMGQFKLDQQESAAQLREHLTF